jgi:Cu/Ag efflux pump CusA
VRAAQPSAALGWSTAGQFESAADATRSIALLSNVVIVGIFLLLVAAFSSMRNALLTLINLALAPRRVVALTSDVVSVASVVGFITLFAIATRNGILTMSHFEHLIAEEGKCTSARGVAATTERLARIVMTAVHHPRARAATDRGRKCAQRDPGANGRCDCGRVALVHIPQHARRAGALPTLRPAA